MRDLTFSGSRIKKRHKIAWGAHRTELPTEIELKAGLGARWADFGGVWNPFGRLLDVSGPAFGRSWDALEGSWAPVGSILGAS